MNHTIIKKQKKILKGIVVSTKCKKTIVVKVEHKTKHPLYKKLVIKHKKYHVHDEKEEAKNNDFVEFSETRPISALKCWKLNKILIPSKV